MGTGFEICVYWEYIEFVCFLFNFLFVFQNLALLDEFHFLKRIVHGICHASSLTITVLCMYKGIQCHLLLYSYVHQMLSFTLSFVFLTTHVLLATCMPHL